MNTRGVAEGGVCNIISSSSVVGSGIGVFLIKNPFDSLMAYIYSKMLFILFNAQISLLLRKQKHVKILLILFKAINLIKIYHLDG